MAKRQIFIQEVGLVTMAKRRGSTNLRLSIRPDNQVQLSMPYWIPFKVGEEFIKQRRDWVIEQARKNPPRLLRHGDQIGKYHRLYFTPGSNRASLVKVGSTEIHVSSDLDPSNHHLQQKVLAASERALKMQSEKLITPRIKNLGDRHDLRFSSLRFRKLTSRWGSCTAEKDITISIYLIQLPWELIDYVLLHELAHTRYLGHDRRFWDFMESAMPQAKLYRKQIKDFRPTVVPA